MKSGFYLQLPAAELDRSNTTRSEQEDKLWAVVGWALASQDAVSFLAVLLAQDWSLDALSVLFPENSSAGASHSTLSAESSDEADWLHTNILLGAVDSEVVDVPLVDQVNNAHLVCFKINSPC